MWATGGGGGGPGAESGPGVGGGGPWPTEWPVNQNMYQNIPHDKIDWAALAQQWIQMRETTATVRGAGVDNAAPPPHLTGLGGPGGGGGRGFDRNPILHSGGGGGGPLPAQQQMMRMANTPLVTTSMQREVHLPDNSSPQLDGAYGSPPYWNPGPWGSNAAPGWVAPPPPPSSLPHPHPHNLPLPNLPPSSEMQKGPVQTFDYGHVHGNQGYASQTYDYNHGTDQIGLNQSFVPDSQQFNQYWTPGGGSGGGFPPPFLRRENPDLLDHNDRSNIPIEDEYGQGSALDAAKRKNLPAWIREGLEKMEREKQKKLEREEMLKERERRLCAQREEDERNLAAFEALKGKEEREAAMAPRRSKFESDSDNGSDSESEGDRSKQERSPLRRESPSPYQPPKTEQDRMEEMMVRVRRLLTEVLLEVTNEEVNSMAKEVFNKARAKAPAQQLAKSSALASITGAFGYSSDSDGETGADDDGLDSDAELEEVIRRRRFEFSQKEKEFASSLYGDDASQDDSDTMSRSRDEELAQKSEKFVPSFLAPSPNGAKEQSDFEKKWYEAVPGLGTAGNCTEIQGEGPVMASVANNKIDTKEAVVELKNSPESDSTKSSRNSSPSRSSRHGEHDSPIGRHLAGDSKRSRSRDRERSRDRDRSSRRHQTDRNRDRIRVGRGHHPHHRDHEHGDDRSRAGRRSSYSRRSSRSTSRDRGGGGNSSSSRRGRRRRSYSRSASRSCSRDRYVRRSKGDRRRRHSSSSSSSSSSNGSRRSRSQTKRGSDRRRRSRNGSSRSRSPRDK